MDINQIIREYCQKADQEVLQTGKKYVDEGSVVRLIMVKPGVYRALISREGEETKVVLSFLNDQLNMNCSCHTFQSQGFCAHTAAALWALSQQAPETAGYFESQPVDRLVYDYDEATAKAYLTYEIAHSQYRREFIKFLFYRLKDQPLTADDYQYIFDYLYILSDAKDRVRVMNRLYDALLERFHTRLMAGFFAEALLIIKMMVTNEADMTADVESNLAYFEEHLSRNVMHIKSALKYVLLYAKNFNDMETDALQELVKAICGKTKIYVGCYLEVKQLVYEHLPYTTKELAEAVKNLYPLLAKCSDVCRQSTIELVFRLIAADDRDYPFYKAIYCELLFSRAYHPGALNVDLLDEIKKLNEDTYTADINTLARYVNEKNSQKQFLDVLVHDENWRELATHAMTYPNLHYLYTYHPHLKAALGNDFTSTIYAALAQYAAHFPDSQQGDMLTYLYCNDGEPYFIMLADMIKDQVSFDRLKDVFARVREAKYHNISVELPVNQNFERYYQTNFSQS